MLGLISHGPMTYKRAKSKITDDHVIAKQNIISRWSSSSAGDLSNVEPCRKCRNCYTVEWSMDITLLV